MEWVAWGILVLILSGLAAWIMQLRTAGPALLGAVGCVVGAGLGLYGAVSCLWLRQLETSRNLWNVPYGSLVIGLDSLTAIFLLPTFAIGAIAALAAIRRAPGDYAANHPHEHWLFFNITIAAAALALVARNAVLFLFAWEIMTVASFLLVENDQRAPGQRSGGWVYLTAGHIGCACLFVLFALMASEGATLDFSSLKAAGSTATAVFLLACVGFGGKAGLAPLHAWYPESYPHAPAHVGAILSGVVGNLGIYGLLRILTLLGDSQPPPVWYGYALLFAGLASALIGAARSLASHDVARLLAWSSVENFGLMFTGIGAGLLGLAYGNHIVALLGFAGSILHVLNHSVSKALLFLSVGTVTLRSGTRMLDRMGGLAKRLPLTGLLFLIGGLGAASVPPLNGFASEFMLLFSAYTGAISLDGGMAAAFVIAIATLALVGGLAAATYMKAFGFIFLGPARGPAAASHKNEQRRSLLPHCLLAVLALGLAGLSPYVLTILSPAAESLIRLWSVDSTPIQNWKTSGGTEALLSAALGCWLIAGCVGVAYLIRFVLIRGKKAATGPTWDCGYAKPDNRMHYTASSFARPLAETFRMAAPGTDKETVPTGLFPRASSFASENPGVEQAWGYRRIFSAIARIAAKVRLMQTGQVQTYLLYMAVVLVALLLWKLR